MYEAFGGASTPTTDNVYTFPSGSESWAGWKYDGADVFPLSFGTGGSVTVTAASTGTTEVQLHLEYENYPNNSPAGNPEYDQIAFTVSGAEADYTVDIPALGDDTFSSVAVYIVEQDVPVTISNIVWNTTDPVGGGDNGGDTTNPLDSVVDPEDTGIVFNNAFGGSERAYSSYYVATGSESWAGYSNGDDSIYPLSFPNGGTVTFTGESENPVDIRFKFEWNPHPDTEPSFFTDTVTVNGAATEYSVDIPVQDEVDTYSNFLLYVDTVDQMVTLTNVTINGSVAVELPEEPEGGPVANPHFDDLQGWYVDIWDTDYASITHDSGAGSDGEPGFAVIQSGDPLGFVDDAILIANLGDAISVEGLGLAPGNEYTVTIDMKLISGSSLGFVALDFYTADELSIPSSSYPADVDNFSLDLIGDGSTWETYTQTFTVPQDAEFAKIYIFSAPGSVVGFDNVNLQSDTVDTGPILEELGTATDLHGDWHIVYMGVGPTQGDGQWWNIDANGLETLRPALGDDIYRFNADGSFENVLGDETWIEEWQDGQPEGERAPVAPYDGTSIGSWAFDGDARTITITGSNSWIGLVKAITDGDLETGSPVPDSRTYTVTRLNAEEVIVDINRGGGFWRFILGREMYTAPTSDDTVTQVTQVTLVTTVIMVTVATQVTQELHSQDHLEEHQ